MGKQKRSEDVVELLALCRTDDERTVVNSWARGVSLNDMGLKVLRRVQARTPKQRANLNKYNKVYTARKRRVDKGEWPLGAPNAYEAVLLGILDEADRYDTRKYVKTVETWLAQQGTPPPTDARVIYVEDVERDAHTGSFVVYVDGDTGVDSQADDNLVGLIQDTAIDPISVMLQTAISLLLEVQKGLNANAR